MDNYFLRLNEQEQQQTIKLAQAMSNEITKAQVSFKVAVASIITLLTDLSLNAKGSGPLVIPEIIQAFITGIKARSGIKFGVLTGIDKTH